MAKVFLDFRLELMISFQDFIFTFSSFLIWNTFLMWDTGRVFEEALEETNWSSALPPAVVCRDALLDVEVRFSHDDAPCFSKAIYDLGSKKDACRREVTRSPTAGFGLVLSVQILHPIIAIKASVEYATCSLKIGYTPNDCHLKRENNGHQIWGYPGYP